MPSIVGVITVCAGFALSSAINAATGEMTILNSHFYTYKAPIPAVHAVEVEEASPEANTMHLMRAGPLQRSDAGRAEILKPDGEIEDADEYNLDVEDSPRSGGGNPWPGSAPEHRVLVDLSRNTIEEFYKNLIDKTRRRELSLQKHALKSSS